MNIGVFDSGFGGLTVLRALLAHIPEAHYIYLGDTARLPYGSKSRVTIARYAVSSARFLIDQGAELLVIACNTASALALNEIEEAAAAHRVPVVGVIAPGAAEAARASATRDVLIIATSATVESHAYAANCRERGLRAHEKACPLLVPLVEEGWIDHPVTAEVVRIYLDELQKEAANARLSPDTLVLGCTHYPLLREVVRRSACELWNGDSPRIIDSAEATAREVVARVGKLSIWQSSEAQFPNRFYATDSVDKFRRLGERFLGRPIAEVELVDMGG